MIRGIMRGVFFLVLCGFPNYAAAQVVHENGITICSMIISEMTEGKINCRKAREISLAIADAGNRHFGKVTCGDMWLYMAIVHVESGFRNNIINEQNCMGMFQVHAPSWARKFGHSYAALLDPRINADCGIQVLKYYLGLYRRAIPALSAYNSDHPAAAIGYAWAVLNVREKIKKRYTQLYHEMKQNNDKEPIEACTDTYYKQARKSAE